MSTIEKMKVLERLHGDKYYYYLGQMTLDGFEIEESINYLYHIHFGNDIIKLEEIKQSLEIK